MFSLLVSTVLIRSHSAADLNFYPDLDAVYAILTHLFFHSRYLAFFVMNPSECQTRLLVSVCRSVQRCLSSLRRKPHLLRYHLPLCTTVSSSLIIGVIWSEQGQICRTKYKKINLKSNIFLTPRTSCFENYLLLILRMPHH